MIHDTIPQKLLLWLASLAITLMYGMLFDKSKKEFWDRLQFVGAISYMFISLS